LDLKTDFVAKAQKKHKLSIQMNNRITIDSFFDDLQQVFNNCANPNVAASQKAYCRNLFEFYGITTPIRRVEQQELLLKAKRLPLDEIRALVLRLWDSEFRENHYFAQELLVSVAKKLEEKDIDLLSHLITHQSWWETVDVIAPKLVSAYFNKFPKTRNNIVESWLASDNIWLKRSCVIFQLKAKKNTDTACLEFCLLANLGTKEFFINKAIGWMLREYAKTNEAWVGQFVIRYQTQMANLSVREAIKHLNLSINVV
jgi:3-methyladenine DNA glycosylase AlkD